jgi:hypothetical protein
MKPTYQDFDAWLLSYARSLPDVSCATINPANYLNISRHIGFIRNQQGGNWMALALEEIQTAVRAVQKAVP